MQGSQDIEMKEAKGSLDLSFSDSEEELKVGKVPAPKKTPETPTQYFSTSKDAPLAYQSKRPNSPA